MVISERCSVIMFCFAFYLTPPILFLFGMLVDLSRPKPLAPKPIYPALSPSSLMNSSASSTTSSMSASSPVPSPRTSFTKSDVSPASASSTDKLDTSGGDKNDLNNNDDAVMSKRSDLPVRKIAGKKISALFEV